MLPQEYRLKHKRDFDTIFSEGRFIPGSLVMVKIWPIDTEKYPRRAYQATDLRIAVVVGKSVSKSAVARNRLKRQMREALRLFLKDEKIKHGYLITVMAKKTMLGRTYQEIAADVERILRRAGVWV